MKRIAFERGAFEDFTDWAVKNKKIHKRIVALISDLAIDRYAGELTGGAILTVGTGNRSAPSGFRFDADITP